MILNLETIKKNNTNLAKTKKYVSKDDAQAKLMHYCAYQDRCHQEVRSKLIDLGIYGDDLEDIITNLIIDNFLNEERFAQSFARGKFRIKKWGRNKILQELKRKHISPYCIKKAMKEIDEDDYVKVIQTLLEKKVPLVKGKNEYAIKVKLARYMITKGFEPELIWDAINDIFDEK